jgi:hypothetical protein
VIELASKFVAVADEVHRLQSEKGRECELFQKIAEQGHYAGRTKPSGTRQGVYAATAGGEFLGSINSRDARAVAGMLKSALARWQALGEERRAAALPEGQDPPRWESRHPQDGLILRQFVRDLEREKPASDWRGQAWNQDRVWLTREELLALVPPSDAPGASVDWPAAVCERLARLHLVDTVRGQAQVFAKRDVERARIASRVSAADGERVVLALSGSTSARASGTWPVSGFQDAAAPQAQTRGVETELLGRAVFERASGRFSSFELVAIGTRWGGTQFNGRHDDLDPAPIGWSFTLLGDGPDPRLPPAHIWEYGWKTP